MDDIGFFDELAERITRGAAPRNLPSSPRKFASTGYRPDMTAGATNALVLKPSGWALFDLSSDSL